jgi:hypothetical protein
MPRDVIADFENGSWTPSAHNLAAIGTALEAADVIFIDENGLLRLLVHLPRSGPIPDRLRCAADPFGGLSVSSPLVAHVLHTVRSGVSTRRSHRMRTVIRPHN